MEPPKKNEPKKEEIKGNVGKVTPPPTQPERPATKIILIDKEKDK